MIRYFCDICGREIQPRKDAVLEGKTERLMYKVMTAVDGVWNAGLACNDCVLHAINNDYNKEKNR